MQRRFVPIRSLSCSARACAAVLVVTAAPALAMAGTAVGVTLDNDLVTFDTTSPSLVLRKVAITGLQAGENILGVDVRPANGLLYGLGSTSRLYTIDRGTGVATAVGGTPFVPALAGTDFGFDFNPFVDRIRVVSDAEENLRLDPNTGLVAGTDSPLSYALADVNFLTNPNIVAAAYDQNVAGTPTTTLFGIDSNLNVLVRQGDVNAAPTSPNSGFLNTIGALGVDASGLTSFDFVGTSAIAAITPPAALVTDLYTINLSTGLATIVGPIGGGEVIRSFTVVPARLLGVTVDNELVTFAAGSPGVVSALVPVSGLQGGEQIVGIDVRPSNGQLYAVGSTSRLYRVDAVTGAATLVGSGTFVVPLSGTAFGVDFNPAVDRIRVVSDTDQNLRIHPDTGLVADGDLVAVGVQGDTNLTFAAADPNFGVNPNVVAVAYDTVQAGGSAVTLFGIDSSLDILVRQGSPTGAPTSPNTGLLSTVGPLAIDVNAQSSFEVDVASSTAYIASATGAGASTDFYRVNLTTGSTVLVGTVGGGKLIRALTSFPALPAASPPAVDLFGLTATNTLVSFRSDAPGVVSAPIAITGLQQGENVIAIDVRPATGVLYGLSSQSRLYTINRTTGAAAIAGTGAFSPSLSGTEFGFDFNPVADRIRVVSDTDQNLRIDPNTGAVIDSDLVTAGTQIDTNLAFAVGDQHAAISPNVVAVAYDRSAAQAAATTLFGIDAGLDVLVRQGSVNGTPTSPNSGELTTIGALGVDSTGVVGFEIGANDTALAALVVAGGTSKLFRVNLATGAADLLGETGVSLRGITIAPTADAAPAVLPLTVTKLGIKVSFCGTGKDSIALSGSLPAITAPVTGKTVIVDVGGVSRTFVLTSKGKGVSGDDKISVATKAKKGVNAFVVSFKNEDLVAALVDENLTGDATVSKVARQIVVTVTYDGVVYRSTVNLIYSAKIRHSGSATKSKV